MDGRKLLLLLLLYRIIITDELKNGKLIFDTV